MNGTSASGATIVSTGFDRVLGIVDVDGNLYADILAVSGGNVVSAGAGNASFAHGCYVRGGLERRMQAHRA